MPSSLQYPRERHRDLQRKWDQLLQRTVPPKDRVAADLRTPPARRCEQIAAEFTACFGNGDSAMLGRAVYQNPFVPLPVRIRCAVECLPFESPKLSATALVPSQDFAALLDARLRRIAETKMIEGVVNSGG